MSIDNNLSERARRAQAVGRKNWLFVGSDNGGRTAAVLFSMTTSCKRHGIEPFRYLADVLRQLPTMPPGRLTELLPDVWFEPTRRPRERGRRRLRLDFWPDMILDVGQTVTIIDVLS